MSLTSIASEVGYGSPYAFATAFRRHHGLPPGTWRKQQPSELLTLNGVGDTSEQGAPKDHA
jgi:AraC-like DNA-binding protein